MYILSVFNELSYLPLEINVCILIYSDLKKKDKTMKNNLTPVFYEIK